LAAEVNDEVIGTGIDFNPDRFHPYVYSLTKVKWDVVGTVTWASGLKRCDTIEASEGRKYDFNGVLYQTCKSLKLRVNNIGIYHATVFGVEGKCHIHFLVAREGLKNVSPEKFAQEFEQQWCGRFRPYRFGKGYVGGGVGMAEVEPYKPAFGQRGTMYCLKREFDVRGRERERYDYVSKKLFSIIRRADTRPIVPGLPSPHRVA